MCKSIQISNGFHYGGGVCDADCSPRIRVLTALKGPTAAIVERSNAHFASLIHFHNFYMLEEPCCSLIASSNRTCANLRASPAKQGRYY